MSRNQWEIWCWRQNTWDRKLTMALWTLTPVDIEPTQWRCVFRRMMRSLWLQTLLSQQLRHKDNVLRSLHLSTSLSVCLSVCLSVYLSVYLSVCMFVCLSVYLSVYLSVCMFVCLSVFSSLSVCLSSENCTIVAWDILSQYPFASQSDNSWTVLLKR